MSLHVTPLPLAGALLLSPTVHHDDRGCFVESYNARTFAQATGFTPDFVQDNHAESHHQVLRGLHFQRHPYAQGKLVRVGYGDVFDVLVDLRLGSPTLGRWHGVHLSARTGQQLWIPPGFAHGYLTLSASSVFLYKVTQHRYAEAECCLRWNDPDVGIAWPTDTPRLSAKDQQGASLQTWLASGVLAP